MKKTIFTTAAAAILAAGPAAATEQVKIGQLSWDGALAIQHILKTVIEENFDAEVRFVPVETQVAYTAMDRGDGSLDVYPDLWMPNDAALWEEYIAEGSRETVVVGNEPYVGTQG
ncbi:MAG TPA: glycine betaine ABC transporter substrate-binding protein, partial [Alphaproteobacteria bacterium]|nr:glycine betaine ABC transporter substrate-binding protein [Alphaproteobacteria bacterium]